MLGSLIAAVASFLDAKANNGLWLLRMEDLDPLREPKGAAEKILDNIDNILEDRAKFIDQDHSKATYASKIQKAEGEINWKNNAKNIIGKINGLHPVPGAYFIYKGERYKILKAEIGSGIGKLGEVISDYLEIACGEKQSIKIKEIQRQGKKPQNIGEFMLGSQIKKGIIV